MTLKPFVFRSSPLSASVREMSAHSGGELHDESFSLVGVKGKIVSIRSMGPTYGTNFQSKDRRLYCFACNPLVLNKGTNNNTPSGGCKRDSNVQYPAKKAEVPPV